MTVDRTIIAMVVAHTNFAGMDREKFAEFAEKRKVYRQKFPLYPDTPIAFFVLGKGDETLSALQLADLASAEPLVIALPSDGLNIKMLSALWLIDVIRRGIYKKPEFEIYVVGEVGKNATAGEVKYDVKAFYSLQKLLSTIDSFPSLLNRKMFLECVRGKCGWVDKPCGTVRLSNALIKRAMNIVLPKSGVTLTEIKERIPKVKPLCPPGDPDSGIVADIEEAIQSNIDIMGQEEVASTEDKTKPEVTSTKEEPKPEATPQELLSIFMEVISETYKTPQEALIICMEVISETYDWKLDEIKLKLTPAGYAIMP